MGSRIILFGTFQARMDAGELFREGIRLKLGGQPFQVLEILLSRPGEVVTREELRTAVWQSDTFVDFDHGLNSAINKIRDALCDSASNPRFVETVPRRGYRFIAPVSQPETNLPAAAITVVDPPERPPHPAPPATNPPSRIWIGAIAGASAVLALVAGLSLSRIQPATQPKYRMSQITRDAGLTHQPGISADGNFVVYASDRASGKDSDIWFQHVAGGQPVRLTSSPDREDRPTISADGRKVVYQRWGEDPGIFAIPALGGTPKKLVEFGRDPQISPDGTKVAYSTGFYNQASEIRVVSAEGGEPRTVATGLPWAAAPIWTTDGKHLLVWSHATTGPVEKWPDQEMDYWMVPASGGVPVKTGTTAQLAVSRVRAMLFQPFTYTQQHPPPIASAGAGGVVIAAGSRDMHELWLCPLSGGQSSSPAVQITLGALAAHPSVAGTGRIAYSRISAKAGLWMLPLDASTGRVTGEMRRVWSGSARAAYAHLSADGKKMTYVSNRNGDSDIWVRDLETGHDRQLTFSREDEFRALISPDGSRVLYARHASDLYTIPFAGGEETLVCEKCGVVSNWSPDGKKVLYQYGVPRRFATAEVATGKKEEVPYWLGLHISPDGLWDVGVFPGEGRRGYYLYPFQGRGKPETRIPITEAFGSLGGAFWSPDGNMIYYQLDNTLWARQLHPKTKRPLGEPILVKHFAEADRPTFSVRCVTKDAIYFTLQEMRANLWIADPTGH